jgi:hypothetical protein
MSNDAEDDFMSDKSHDMAEGQQMGEYGRVLSALGLYVPDKFSMEELNTPDGHRVIASKADVPVEYAGKVIDDFTRPVDGHDDDEWPEDDEQGVAEVSDATLTSYLTKLDKDNLKHRMDPTKRSDTKRMKSGPNFVKAFTKLDNRKQGVAEGDPQLQPGMQVKDGTIVKVNGNTVTIKTSNGDLMNMNIHDVDVAQNMAEGKKKSEPPEADYGADYQDMVSRVKKLAGLGPLKTVYDPQKRVYKNVPVAVQPKKEQR